jgi:hypothetical protein
VGYDIGLQGTCNRRRVGWGDQANHRTGCE